MIENASGVPDPRAWRCTRVFTDGKVCGQYNHNRPLCIYCGAKRP